MFRAKKTRLKPLESGCMDLWLHVWHQAQANQDAAIEASLVRKERYEINGQFTESRMSDKYHQDK